MQSVIDLRNKLDNTFWISSLTNNKVTQLVFPVDSVPNNKFVYMGYAGEYTPSMTYYPDVSFYDVRIGVDGKLYLPLRHSSEITDNKITFTSGEIWNKVENIPKSTFEDYTNINTIRKLNQRDTTYLWNKMYPIYGTHPIVPGQKLPQ
jgi:hypothetical protein